MKNISVLALSAMTTIGAIPFGAIAEPVSHINANGIAVHNIDVLQHTIMLNAFDNFNGSYANSFTKGVTNSSEQVFQNTTPNDENDVSKHYGKMLTYGEYGDDGTVFNRRRGRNGGDETIPDVSLWIDWHHAQDNVNFDKFRSVDSRNDIFSVGFSDIPTQIDGGISTFGGFGGVIIANEDSGAVELSETGEYIGLYKGYYINGFNVNIAADAGTLFSDTKSAYGKYDLTNLWIGAATSVSYNIVLDEFSVLQPGLYAGYTWIRSDGYETNSGQDISFDDFNVFELSPALRSVNYIGDGWYGVMSARYVFNFANGGAATVNNPTVVELDMSDYAEYGLSFEKNMDNLSISATINRRNGGRTGWSGGLHARYLF